MLLSPLLLLLLRARWEKSRAASQEGSWGSWNAILLFLLGALISTFLIGYNFAAKYLFRMTLLFCHFQTFEFLFSSSSPGGLRDGKETREEGGESRNVVFLPPVSFSPLYKGLKLYIDTSPSNFPPTTRKNKKIKLSWTRIFFEALLTLPDVERNISFPARVAPKKKSFRKCQQGRWGRGKDERCGERSVFPALKFLT